MPTTLVLAWKVLARRKLFTAISLFGVALTMLVLIVVSSLLDHVFAPRAPQSRFDRVLGVWSVELVGAQVRYSGLAGHALIPPLAGIAGVEEMAVFSLPRALQVWVDGREIRTQVKRADAAYWRVLDFTFLEGEPWSADHDREERRVAVINAATRRAVFGSASAIGRTLELDGRSFEVIGVVADVPAVRIAGYADVWVPLATSPTGAWRHEQRGTLVPLFLARDRAAFPRIRAEVRARLAAQTPTDVAFTTVRGSAEPLFEAAARFLFGDGDTASTHRSSTAIAEPPPPPASRSWHLVSLLAGLGLLFMILPAVNLANIHHSRIRERATEIGVRKAFGAPARSLLGQFLVENLVLTALGALFGLIAAALVLFGLNASGAIPHASFAINWRVGLWGLAAAAVFGVLSGVYPAWRMARLDPVSALRGRS